MFADEFELSSRPAALLATLVALGAISLAAGCQEDDNGERVFDVRNCVKAPCENTGDVARMDAVDGTDTPDVMVRDSSARDSQVSDSGDVSPDGTPNDTAARDTNGGMPDTADTSVPTGSSCLETSHPMKVDFGRASTGTASTRTITIENCQPRDSTLVVSNISVSDDAGGAFSIKQGSLPGNLPGGNLTKSNDTIETFVVEFQPSALKTYNGELLIESNDPARSKLRVTLTGEGSDNACPTANASGRVQGAGGGTQTTLSTQPLETIELLSTGSQDPDGSIDRYEWSIIQRPSDSTARIRPSNNVQNPTLYLDLVGTYKIELVVYDNEGSASCGQRAVVDITATPDEKIYVELVWDTPRDGNQTDTSGSDMDLHYRKKGAGMWNAKPWDVFWHNRTADWGVKGKKADDPEILIDDEDGAGPEAIAHPVPDSGNDFSVGVYYYDDNGFGPSYMTTRIYIRSTLAQSMKNAYFSGSFEFLHAFNISWPSGKVYVVNTKTRTGFP